MGLYELSHIIHAAIFTWRVLGYHGCFCYIFCGAHGLQLSAVLLVLENFFYIGLYVYTVWGVEPGYFSLSLVFLCCYFLVDGILWLVC